MLRNIFRGWLSVEPIVDRLIAFNAGEPIVTSGQPELRSAPSREKSRALPEGFERRFVAKSVQIRAAAEGQSGPGTLFGYAATFDQLSVDLGGFIEKIAPGAFTEALVDADCRCLRNHCDESILGRQSAGTLRLSEDDTGLFFECDLPDTSVGRDIAESVRRRDIQGCSFQFVLAEGGEAWDFQVDPPVRTITRFSQLLDVGPVTFPAYESTVVDMRSLNAAREARKALDAASIQLSQARARARLRLAEVTSYH